MFPYVDCVFHNYIKHPPNSSICVALVVTNTGRTSLDDHLMVILS